MEKAVWWAVGMLIGIDSRHGEGKPYLHDEQQIAGWLVGFRRLGRATR